MKLHKKTTKEFDLMARDGRNVYYLTFDTETIGIDEKYIYDFGFAIHNKKGEIIYKRNFLIAEVFDDMALMKRAYYGEKKYQSYVNKLEKGEIEKLPLKTVLKFFTRVLNEYGIDTICAYNIVFDIQAFYSTVQRIIYGFIREEKVVEETTEKSKKSYDTPYFEYCLKFLNKNIFGRELKALDIYGMTCEIILTQKTYINMAVRNEWFTPKGNILTNAECAYRYISGNHDFIESHTALDDVMIEVQILAKCFAAHKKFTKKIIYSPYKIVKSRWQQLQAV